MKARNVTNAGRRGRPAHDRAFARRIEELRTARGRLLGTLEVVETKAGIEVRVDSNGRVRTLTLTA